MSFSRTLPLKLPRGRSAFLWGPRQTGKTTLLRERFPESPFYDLLDTQNLVRLTLAPHVLRQELAALPSAARAAPIIIDEIQKVPALLDEVHAMIEQEHYRFILCGSSTRKLRRAGVNLLGGRAWRFELHPLTYPEIPSFDLLQALNHGLLPAIYPDRHYRRALRAYVQDYLKQEVFDEGLTRNVAAFSRFFEALSYCHGELINYSAIARDCGVDSKTVREYFQILTDTLVGHHVPPFSRRTGRQAISHAQKFFLFDVGVAAQVTRRHLEDESGTEFGRAFEHFVLMELIAFRSYREAEFDVAFWRTKSGLEVDYVLDRGRIAVEVKSRVRTGDLKSIAAFVDEFKPKRAIVVSNERQARIVDGIEILPWRRFLGELWDTGLGLA
jgi:predicted AAA+ superfamily ATPase